MEENLEDETKNSAPKVGINVTMVDQDQLVLDLFVTTRGQKTRMLKEELQDREVNPTRGQ